MNNAPAQKLKAQSFRQMHHDGNMLVLPNIWDPLGAQLLESLDYPAVATASASIAFSNGYDDGQNIPFDDVLVRLRQIVKSVSVPVTADIEGGYASDLETLKKNIEQLIATGIIGINLEDYDTATNSFFPIEVQCQRLRLIRQVSEAMDVPVFINARTDVYLRKNKLPEGEKLNETIQRAEAYISAGADCIFPPAMKNKTDLETLVNTIKCPVNVLALPGIPTLKVLRGIGISRLSLGPGLLKIAIKAMKDVAMKLKNYEGLEEVTENDITSEYLKRLVTSTK